MTLQDFFTELKRRNVIRMARLYLVGAWLLVQLFPVWDPLRGDPRFEKIVASLAPK